MSDFTPATPFMKGYRRPQAIEDQLIAAVTRAIVEHPTWRFGQIVVNLLGDDPFNTWDEETIGLLLGGTSLLRGIKQAAAGEIVDRESKR